MGEHAIRYYNKVDFVKSGRLWKEMMNICVSCELPEAPEYEFGTWRDFGNAV